MHQDTYEQNPGLRRSDLWQIHITPKHFKQAMDSKRESKTLNFGIAMHKYLLESDTFDDEYAVSPNVDRRTKLGKSIYADFEQNLGDKLAISEAEFSTIKAMTETALANPLVKQLLDGIHEGEYYWTDPTTKEPLKCKTDCITTYEGQEYIVDYKTTDSCADGHFEYASRKYGYQFQAGFYTAGLEQCTGKPHGFAFIAQEKKAPFACRVYVCSPEYIRNGQDIFHQLLETYHQCKITNDWYGYGYSTHNPAPTILMDDAERYAAKRQAQVTYQSTMFGYDNNDVEDDE